MARAKGEQGGGGPRIEMMPLSGIQVAKRNPKRHEVLKLLESLDRFGFVAPLVMDDTTGRLVAGHGRLEALHERKKKGLPPPQRIEVKEGDWLVPVLRGVSFATESEAEAYLLADNRLAELGGWDEKSLALMLADVAKLGDEALSGVGWDRLDVATMITETQLQDLKIPALQIGKDAAGTDPRDEKWWVWADCTSEAEMNAILARYGMGKGRQMSVERLLAGAPEPKKE